MKFNVSLCDSENVIVKKFIDCIKKTKQDCTIIQDDVKVKVHKILLQVFSDKYEVSWWRMCFFAQWWSFTFLKNYFLGRGLLRMRQHCRRSVQSEPRRHQEGPDWLALRHESRSRRWTTRSRPELVQQTGNQNWHEHRLGASRFRRFCHLANKTRKTSSDSSLFNQSCEVAFAEDTQRLWHSGVLTSPEVWEETQHAANNGLSSRQLWLWFQSNPAASRARR